MPGARRKKSEMLEIRVTHETKTALTERCLAEGRSISDAVRSLIDDYISSPEIERDIIPENRSIAIMDILKQRPGTVLATLMGAGALTLAALSPAASADTESTFGWADFNKDQLISFSEYRDITEQYLITYDVGVGHVLRSRPEQQGDYIEDILRRDFEAYDLDGDGQIRLAEFRPRYDLVTRTVFYQLDADLSNSLDVDEFSGGVMAVGTTPLAEGETYQQRATVMFTDIDTNTDGQISLAEYQAPPRQ